MKKKDLKILLKIKKKRKKNKAIKFTKWRLEFQYKLKKRTEKELLKRKCHET